MTLVGGGGAGYTAGSNPAGTGTTLNYIGDHVYAYSGTFQSTNASQTMLDFSTGSEYIVGNLTLNAAIDFAQTDAGVGSAFRISINGEVISLIKTESGAEDMPTNSIQELILAPFTDVKVEVIASGNNTSFLNTINFVGRVY
jgi:hypothetical protein